jgi:integrase
MPKILLTQRFITQELQCPPTKKRIEYCDTQFPGLYIDVRATNQGQGTYYLRYKNAQSKTCHQKLGRTHELTLPQARKRAKSLKAEILLGADPRAEAKHKKLSITFSTFTADHYLPYIKTRKRSYANDESMLNLRLLDVFGDHPLNTIRRQQIQTMHTALREEGLSASSCDHHVKLIRYMLNLAVQWELIDKNPADKIPLFNEDNRVENYMSEEELRRLLTVMTNDKSKVICQLILFLLNTGARMNEAAQAKWEDIDSANCVWRIPAANSKSKRVKSVPLNQAAIAIIETMSASKKHAYVFANPKTGKPYVNINKPWRRIREAADLPHLRIHDLRHQFASHLVNSGRSLYEVQQILGHSDPSVTQRYAHLSARSLREAAETGSVGLGDARA